MTPVVKDVMSEREAWLLLAKLWRSANVDDEGDVYAYHHPDVEWGLCDSICNLFYRGEIDERTKASMKRQIPSKRLPSNYAWPLTVAGARARVRFCVLQARLLKPKKRKRAE